MTRPLSPDEAATVARFDAAPDAPESLRERVARALWETVDDWPWERASEQARDYARRQADAALAVIRGES